MVIFKAFYSLRNLHNEYGHFKLIFEDFLKLVFLDLRCRFLFAFLHFKFQNLNFYQNFTPKKLLKNKKLT